jgi:hypothetical protein
MFVGRLWMPGSKLLGPFTSVMRPLDLSYDKKDKKNNASNHNAGYGVPYKSSEYVTNVVGNAVATDFI